MRKRWMKLVRRFLLHTNPHQAFLVAYNQKMASLARIPEKTLGSLRGSVKEKKEVWKVSKRVELRK